jgi:PII-like signaling protein
LLESTPVKLVKEWLLTRMLRGGARGCTVFHCHEAQSKVRDDVPMKLMIAPMSPKAIAIVESEETAC